ncbi:GNAT family N-acetyltransferase [Actinoplanes sp. NPDC026623]|uniref:GNAT family N-acetyltransferase n=1 Tax=Actinoplanes sp. NPDC026623 TaxID=3155610 RepID=UPI0033CAAC0C
MRITLRALTDEDIEAHNAGEDEHTVRWLNGAPGTAETTAAHFDSLADNARAERGKRGFGVCLDDHLAGYVDCDPDVTDGLEPGDVNISYAVHPWARGHGVAGEAVRLILEYMRENRIGTRAVVRVDPDNVASVCVAEKSGFIYVHDFTSGTDRHPDGTRQPVSGLGRPPGITGAEYSAARQARPGRTSVRTGRAGLSGCAVGRDALE